METLTPYTVTIRETPAIRVAALAHTGDYQAIGAAFERVTMLAIAQGLLVADARSFGIYYDDPEATATEALRADACLSLPAERGVSGDLQVREIRGGRYAVTLHVGPYAELSRAYMWLHGVWLPESGEEPADAPVVEEYLNDPRTLPPTEWRTEVWLPLK